MSSDRHSFPSTGAQAGGELDFATGTRVLRLPQVRAMTGLGRSSIYQMERERRFPRRIKIGSRAVGWIEGEVIKWINERIASRQTLLIK
jgi:prophage regulatory protein